MRLRAKPIASLLIRILSDGGRLVRMVLGDYDGKAGTKAPKLGECGDYSNRAGSRGEESGENHENRFVPFRLHGSSARQVESLQKSLADSNFDDGSIGAVNEERQIGADKAIEGLSPRTLSQRALHTMVFQYRR